jgi:hypothetical protein
VDAAGAVGDDLESGRWAEHNSDLDLDAADLWAYACS